MWTQERRRKEGTDIKIRASIIRETHVILLRKLRWAEQADDIGKTSKTYRIIAIFQGVGFLACFDFRTYFSETYKSIWRVIRTPWTGNRPDTKPLPTQDSAKHTHPCLERDSNPRSQCSSDRRQYVPQTARPLGPATYRIMMVNYWKPTTLNT
jgi:hypothetical protein